MPDPPRKPQIQAAAAKIVKDSVLFERLIINVDAPHCCWKGCPDTWRDSALLAGVAGLCVAAGASVGIIVWHRLAKSRQVPTLGYDDIISAMRCERIGRSG